ncbi:MULTISPECIES: phage major capsid protein [Paenibacillus]|uniref:Phage major capsid protein n=1 Tax=Paenibacillus artemisiicola TaxID=1172618 RepID=A0ABS3W785_9BACL|nr:phage major capsid protein [Paenibacillus artemisiicola]MBO7744172.1 phage major capsid protein [Paenibacillus artemisiicola]
MRNLKKINALKQQMAEKRTLANQMADENKLEEVRAISAEMRTLKEQIEALEELDNVDQGRISNDSKVDPLGGEPAAGALNETRSLKREQRMSTLAKPYMMDGQKRTLSLGKYVKGIVTGNWTNAEAERRAMSENVLTGGGVLVPELLSTEVIDLARNQARVIQAGALTIPMESNALTLAKVINGPAVAWKAENAPIAESDVTFGAADLKAKTLVGMVRLSVELFEDAENIDSIIEQELAAALALELDRATLFGTGIDDEPLGLYRTSGLQKIDMGVNGDKLEGYFPFSQAAEMIQNVNGEATGVIWAPRTAGAVDRLTDTSGQPLKAPASFESLKKYSTNQVPINLAHGTTNNASVALLGDWSKLYIGTRTNLTLETSREAEGAFGKLQVVIRAYLRADVLASKPNHFVAIEGIVPA